MVYLPIIIALRPFKKVTDNLIEIMNEVFFMVLLSLLVFLNKSDEWDSATKNVYLNIIISNSCVILLLMLGNSSTNI